MERPSSGRESRNFIPLNDDRGSKTVSGRSTPRRGIFPARAQQPYELHILYRPAGCGSVLRPQAPFHRIGGQAYNFIISFSSNEFDAPL
jgi:hypothetical protein